NTALLLQGFDQEFDALHPPSSRKLMCRGDWFGKGSPGESCCVGRPVEFCSITTVFRMTSPTFPVNSSRYPAAACDRLQAHLPSEASQRRRRSCETPSHENRAPRSHCRREIPASCLACHTP